MDKIIPTLAASVGVTFLPAIAYAHTGVGSTSGFGAGILHPIGGIDHVLAMMTVGLLAGVAGGRARWALPIGSSSPCWPARASHSRAGACKWSRP